MTGAWRKAAAGLTLLAVLTGGGITGTIGYFSAREEVPNVFTVGDLDVALEEPEWEPELGDGRDLCPGYSVYKNPTIENRTEQGKGGPCYVRMRMRVLDASGKQITQEDRLKLILTTIRYDETFTGTIHQKGEGSLIREGRLPGYSLEEVTKLPMVNPLFVKDEMRSGAGELVFNYLGRERDGIFRSGDQATLFTDLVIPSGWNKEKMELMGEFTLEIRAEAIQTQGFTTMRDALTVLDDEQKGGVS
ncbi:MAG: SipW-dependent-type signal peptide-containing protein [Eubacteriales bacterium]|nr:SipW-dependent-type signal peptide-containing protein [Eubacteriales bacterium]